MPKSKLNHKKRFNKKQAVRFALIPGPQKDGKPTTIFQPVQAQKTRLSIRERQEIIKQLTDETFDLITINGKQVASSNEIPAFVLQQIRGRKDIVFNQKNPMMEQQQMIQDEEDLIEEDDYQDYQDQGNMQLDGDFQDQEQYEGDQNQILEEQQEWESDGDADVNVIEVGQQEKQQNTKQFQLKSEDFPVIQQTVQVEFQGQKYILTKKQQELLNCVLPENYHEIIIPGIKFKKFNEDGLDMQYRQKYEKFISNDSKNVIDSYQYVPTKPIDRLDNDLRPDQIKGQLKQIHEALDFQGQEDGYQELEDDFFAKMIAGNVQQQQDTKKTKKKDKKTIRKQNKAKTSKQGFQSDGGKFESKAKNVVIEEPQITDEMLEKALKQFQNEDKMYQQESNQNDQSMKELMNIHDLQKMQEYLGKDGQLDWRKLSKAAKKQYMRQKRIRQSYDIARQREIQQKMKDKKNVKPEDLHLKQWIAKIPIQQDHVMQALLEKGDQGKGLQDSSSQYDTTSEQDDITSYRLKTSVIANNLSIIEEPSTRKRKDKKKDQEEQNWKDQSMQNSLLQKQKPKYVPGKRDKNESKQERKARKEAVKQLKKANKEYKRQFNKQFGQQQKKFSKGQNKSAFHKVSVTKIN